MWTPASLRAVILAALARDAVPIGTYTYKDGSTEPAFRVGEKEPSNLESTSGLEVVLLDTPSPTIRRRFGDGHTPQKVDWEIRLKRWDDPDPDVPFNALLLTQAVDALSATVALTNPTKQPRVLPSTNEFLAEVIYFVPEMKNIKRF